MFCVSSPDMWALARRRSRGRFLHLPCFEGPRPQNDTPVLSTNETSLFVPFSLCVILSCFIVTVQFLCLNVTCIL